MCVSQHTGPHTHVYRVIKSWITCLCGSLALPRTASTTLEHYNRSFAVKESTPVDKSNTTLQSSLPAPFRRRTKRAPQTPNQSDLKSLESLSDRSRYPWITHSTKQIIYVSSRVIVEHHFGQATYVQHIRQHIAEDFQQQKFDAHQSRSTSTIISCENIYGGGAYIYTHILDPKSEKDQHYIPAARSFGCAPKVDCTD